MGQEIMNILFVFSRKDANNYHKPITVRGDIQLGISSISALLKAQGHRTSLIVLCHKTPKHILIKHINCFNPQLICFSAVFTEYDFIANIATFIKSNYPRIFLLAGGVHVTLNPQETINDSFDAICIGEGEFPTLELVRQLENNLTPKQIPNLWIKTGEVIDKTPPRPFIENLDDLPFTDRDIWEPWIQSPLSEPSVLLGRGCPFQCTYCCNHALRKVSSGTYVRFRSPDHVIRELKEIRKKYPQTQSVNFEIETIGVDKKYPFELCSQLTKYNRSCRHPLSYGINLRITPNADFRDLFKAMQQANFGYIRIGLESGNERIRKDILKRIHSNDDFLNAVKFAKQYGLEVYIFVMIGLPGETWIDFQDTIDCVRRAQPKKTYFFIFYPYPGTILYQRCVEENLIPPKLDTKAERFRSILNLPGFSKKQIQREYNWFLYKVYKGRRSWRDIAKEMKYHWQETYELLYQIDRYFSFWISLFHKIKYTIIGGKIRI
jgi:anaerobic magnesium-protoporphyrin IX monomethyl ester cyclase